MAIKALLVEDSPADARIIQELLRQAGGRQVLLKRADRISAALESLDSEKPDVVILDLKLPDSKGLSTFRRVHTKTAALPIVVLTGLDDIDMALETIAEGASDYLLKSDLSGGLLMRVLRYSIERKRIETSLLRTERELEFKNRIAGPFLTAPDLEMPAGVVRAMLEFMQSEEGVFGYIDRDGPLICHSLARAGAARSEVLRNKGPFPRESWTGIWGRALAEKRPLLFNEPAQEMDTAVRRVLAVPLLDRGELIGLFEVANKASDYDAADRDLLERAAAYLAPILHVRLQRDAHQRALATALKAAEILLQEVHHRVKNNLQIISSLLNLQSEGLPEEAQKVLDESQRRVRSMALVHEQLYNRERPDQLDFEEYVGSLTGELFAAYSHSARIQSRVEVDPVLLNINQAIPCGLILNELVTNALKYAFPQSHSGEIVVALHCSTEGRVTLRVADNGIGLAPGFDWRRSESLGLRIVDILTHQLNGKLEFSGATGAEFTLTFLRDQPDKT